MSRAASLHACVLALAIAGCSSGSAVVTTTDAEAPDAGAEAGALADLRAACGRFAGATCAALQGCHPQSFGRYFASLDACVAANGDGCAHQALGEGNGMTAAAFDACVAAMPPPTDCSTWDHLLLWFYGPPACFPPGTLADGAACQNDRQCRSGYCDNRGTPNFCGQCKEPAVGDTPCSFTLQCLGGYRCVDNRCVKVAELGDSCSASAPCANDLVCNGGKCSPLPGAGGGCSLAVTCQANLGLADLLCDPATWTCTPPPQGGAGDACGDIGGIPHFCGYGLTCSAQSRTCVPRPALGDPCGTYLYDNGCGAEAVCWQGKCVRPDPAYCELPGFPP